MKNLPGIILVICGVLLAGALLFKPEADLPAVDAGALDLDAGIPELAGDAGVDGKTWLLSYMQAKSISQETGRPILVDFTGSDSCHWCIKLDEEVFETAEFQQWAAEKVVLLKLDYPQATQQPLSLARQNEKIAQAYGIQRFPTVLLVDEEGQPFDKLGYVPGGPATWIAQAEQGLAKR